MKARRDKVALWFSALAFVLACLPSLGRPIATVDPNQIDQFIAQTANAAFTQTANALPTSTGMPTITPTSGTFTPSPTFTPTVIFLLPSATPTARPTFALGGGGTDEDDFACEVLSVTPVNGASLRGQSRFDATWQVKNIGRKKWNEGAVRYTFESGDQMQLVASYNLESDVSPDETVAIVVEMESPQHSGVYTTNWALRRGENAFCQLYLTISVMR